MLPKHFSHRLQRHVCGDLRMTVIEQQSTYTSASNLLDKMNTFLTANGWTADLHAGGDVLHIHKGAVFAHMKVAAAGVNPWTTQSIAYTAVAPTDQIALSSSDSYLAGDFDTQPGYPTNLDGGKEIGVVMDGLADGSKNYWFFLGTSPDAFYCIAQVAADRFRFLAFGELDKVGTYTGGQFISASRSRFTVNQSGSYMPPLGCSRRSDTAHNTLVRVNHASFNGWAGSAHDPTGDNEGMSTGARLATTLTADNDAWRETGINNLRVPNYGSNKDLATTPDWQGPAERAFNSGNSLSILLPVMAFMSRPDLSFHASHSVIGKFPHCYYVNMANLNTDTVYVYGAANYRAMATYSAANNSNTLFRAYAGLAFPVV